MKKKNILSCWNWKRPFRSLKNCWWRITKGYCPDDIWDWYTYMAQLIHDTFLYLAAHHMGTMMEYADNDKGYTDKLESVARTILDATNYEEVYENPFREDYYKDLEKVYIDRKGGSSILNFDKTDDALFKHFQFVEERNYKKARENLKEAFSWIVEHWFDLWD